MTEMMKKPATLIAIVLLGLVAIAHLARLVLGVEVMVGGRLIPAWVSVPGFLVPAILSVLIWRERNRG